VHIFTAPRSTYKGTIGTVECIFKLFIRTIHVFAASRAMTDRHAGRKDKAWEGLGDDLEQLMQAEVADRNKRKQSDDVKR
jgi:hypothetical protein